MEGYVFVIRRYASVHVNLGHIHPEDYPRDFRHVIALIPVTRPSRRVFASNGNEDGSGHNLHDLYHPSHPAHYVD